MGIIAFVLLLGALVFIHELGHFAVAKWCGVRVLTFSIGFGPRLFGFKRGDTDYRISAIPLGGYVRMYGDNFEEVVPEDQKRFSFLFQSYFRKSAIAFAGPLANFILPLFIFTLLFVGRHEVQKAKLGTIFRGSPADQAGLQVGDEVIAIDGEPMATFNDLHEKVSSSPNTNLTFKLRRGEEELALPVYVEVVQPIKEFQQEKVTGRIGVMPGHLASEAQSVDGLVCDSKLRKVNVKEPIQMPYRCELLLKQVQEEGGYKEVAETKTIMEKSVASKLGLSVGDIVLTLDGRRLSAATELTSMLQSNMNKEHTMTWVSEKQIRQGVFRMESHPKWGLEEIKVLGASFSSNFKPGEMTTINVGLGEAVRESFSATWSLLKRMTKDMVKLFTFQVSPKQMGGAIMIYQIAEDSFRAGWKPFLDRMALISVSLGIINLVPVPALDGGHLLLFTIEAITRKPLSIRTRKVATIIGFVFLLGLMVLAFTNDLIRLFQ